VIDKLEHRSKFFALASGRGFYQLERLDDFQALADATIDEPLPLGGDRMILFLFLRRDSSEEDRFHGAQAAFWGLWGLILATSAAMRRLASIVS
jgi:hypothetical protein